MKNWNFIIWFSVGLTINLAFGLDNSHENYSTLTELIYSDQEMTNTNIIYKMNLLSINAKKTNLRGRKDQKEQLTEQTVNSQLQNAEIEVNIKHFELQQKDEDSPDGGLFEEIEEKEKECSGKLVSRVLQAVENYLFKNGKGVFFQIGTNNNSSTNQQQPSQN